MLVLSRGLWNLATVKPRLCALTQGDEQPGRRFRWRQYVPDLESAGFEVTELGSAVGAYAPEGFFPRFPWLASTLVDSFQRVLTCRNHDLVFLQRSLTATLATWEFLIRPPFVMDVDDAIFLGARGKNAGRIARLARVVICGNQFLADYFSNFCAVAVIPTAVDTEEFRPSEGTQQDSQVIGWSGSSSGFAYLRQIEPALDYVLRKFPRARLRIVSDKPPAFLTLDPDRVEYERWTPERQVASLQEFTIGIMPLTDSPWARGKCSYKMLTYMAVGVPVLVSPVGMNVEVLAHGRSGFAAQSIDDWTDTLSTMLSDAGMRRQMGGIGRGVVEEHYSRKVLAPRLVDVLRQQL